MNHIIFKIRSWLKATTGQTELHCTAAETGKLFAVFASFKLEPKLAGRFSIKSGRYVVSIFDRLYTVLSGGIILPTESIRSTLTNKK